MAGQPQRCLHQSRAKATTSWSALSPPCWCVLGGSAKTFGLCKERGEALMESIQAQKNPPCTSEREKVEDFPLRGRGFQSALRRGGCPTHGSVCKAHPGSAARPLHCTMDAAPSTHQTPSPCSGVDGSARGTPGSKPPLRGTSGTRMATTAQHSWQQMGHGRGRERCTADREQHLSHCLGLLPCCLRREQEVAPFPAQQPTASSHFPLC